MRYSGASIGGGDHRSILADESFHSKGTGQRECSAFTIADLPGSGSISERTEIIGTRGLSAKRMEYTFGKNAAEMEQVRRFD